MPLAGNQAGSGKPLSGGCGRSCCASSASLHTKEIISPCNPESIPVRGIVLVFRKFDIVWLPSRPVMARAALAPECFFIGFLSMKAEGDERCDDLVSRANRAGASGAKQIQDASQAPGPLPGSMWKRMGRGHCKSMTAIKLRGKSSQRVEPNMLQRWCFSTRSPSMRANEYRCRNVTAIEPFHTWRQRRARRTPCTNLQILDFAAHAALEAAGSVASIQMGCPVSPSGGLLDLKAPQKEFVRRQNVRTTPKNNYISASLTRHAHDAASAQREAITHRGVNAEAVCHAAL
jgi:hypothetical protein